MADEPKLVVALEARLDKFERQLREAGLIAERQMKEIESKTSQITIGVAAGNLLAKGIEKGIKAAIESIKEAIEETKELGTVAKRTALDMETIQRIGGAAVSSGLDSKEFLSGLNSAATKMDEMNRRETELSRFLDLNNVKYRDRTGHIVDANKALEIAADRMSKAGSQIEKEEIARMFGLTEKWVAVLGDGVEKFRQMKAGANVNPELAAAVEQTKLLFSIVNAIGGEFKTWGTEIAAALLPPLQTAISVLRDLSAALAAIHAGTSNFMEGPTKAIADRVGKIAETVDRMTADAARTKLTVSGSGNKFPAAAGAGGEKDALTRQVEQLNKINALTQQELATVGMTVAKQEESRQITLLQEAAKRAGLNADIAVTEEMRKQAEQAGKLKQLLVEREKQWSDMLSASKEFGSMMSDAMKGMVLEGKKFDEVLKNIGNRLASKAFDKLFDVMFASPFGGGGSMFMNLLGIKAGARMAGGPVSGGSPYMVGERGPELFVPNRSGMIVPNTALGGAGGGIMVGGSRTAINIQGSADRSTVAAMQEMLAVRDRRFIADVAGATRELRRRSVRT